MTDATLIPADAALDSLVHNDPGQAREGAQLAQGLWIQLAWLCFFIAASRWAFSRGVKRYSGYGGGLVLRIADRGL